MKTQTLKKHSDFATTAEFIEISATEYDFNKDIRFDLKSNEVNIISSSSTNTIMSQKNPGWDGDSDND